MWQRNDVETSANTSIPLRLLTFVLSLALLGAVASASVDAKPKRPVKPPDLRILDITLSPTPYLPTDGPLDLAVEVELPADLAGTSLLEVSSLITSPSRHSLRFLSTRRSVESSSLSDQVPSVEGKTRVIMTLTWDGTDQTMKRVEKGRYSYEVKAKLLAVGENGPRTQMVSWPKRGTLDIR